MSSDDLNQRLSRMATQWSRVFEAHQGELEAAVQARRALLQRYSRAVFRYLMGAIHDQAAAEDLSQEFALRFLRGDFHRAAPGRGRFRDYVKVALINLVNDYHRTQANWPHPYPADAAEPADRPSVDDSSERDFLADWRTELLDRTWEALQQQQPLHYAALRLRVEYPDLKSQEMADMLTQQQGKPISAALVRKHLERAHTEFAELLLEEVALSLETSDRNQIAEELEQLDLLKYCRTAIGGRP